MCQFCSPLRALASWCACQPWHNFTLLSLSFFHTLLSLPPQGRARQWGIPVKAMIKSSTWMPTGFSDMRGDCVVGEIDGGARFGRAGRRRREKEERHTLNLSGPSRDWYLKIGRDVKRGMGGWGLVVVVMVAGCKRGWKVWGMKGRQTWGENKRKRKVKEKKGREKKLGWAERDMRRRESWSWKAVTGE